MPFHLHMKCDCIRIVIRLIDHWIERANINCNHKSDKNSLALYIQPVTKQFYGSYKSSQIRGHCDTPE